MQEWEAKYELALKARLQFTPPRRNGDAEGRTLKAQDLMPDDSAPIRNAGLDSVAPSREGCSDCHEGESPMAGPRKPEKRS